MNAVLLFLTAITLNLPMLHAEDTTSSIEDLRGSESEQLKKSEKMDQGNIIRHRPIYMIFGKPNTKVQVSLKLRLIERLDLFFAFTQIMFWDLGKKSSPFRDVLYNPEVFYRQKMKIGFWETLDIGIEHQSNGKDGESSRAFDRAYLQFNTVFGLGDRKISWDTRIFKSYNYDETNTDIQKYISFWNTRVAMLDVFEEYLDKTEVYLMFFPGGLYGDKIAFGGGIEGGVKFRFKAFGEMPYFFFQAYSGYAESLLNYNENVKSYRIGILL